jgi:hypothetical protein
MIGCPMTDRLDDSFYLLWLERHLHPDGLKCPQGEIKARRPFRTKPLSCLPVPGLQWQRHLKPWSR